MKKLFLTCMLLLFCCTLSSCSFISNGENGTKEKIVPLSVPEIKEINNGYIYLNEVPNASSYVVEINSYQEIINNSLKCNISLIIDDKIPTGVETELHIFVKAKGNQINYSDSEWSSEYTYKYTKYTNVEHDPNQLSIPEKIYYENNTVHWDRVPNAYKYVIKINETEFTTYENQFTVTLPENGLFNFSIKAISNNSNCLDSNWSSICAFNYKKIESGGVFLQNGIGYTVDVVSAKNYNDYKLGVSVLDTNKLNAASFNKSFNNNNYVKSISSYSITELINKSSLTTELTISNNIKIKGMFCNLETGLKTGNNFEYSNYLGKYYYVLDHYFEEYTLSLKDYSIDNKYIDCLSKEYILALDDLYNKQTEAEFFKFFSKYGTHLIASGIFGGRLNAYFSVITNKVSINEQSTLKINSKVDFGISNVNSSIGLQNEIATTLGINRSDIMISFSAKSYGGYSFGASSIDDFSNNYNVWWDSFNKETSNSTLINYSQDGLIALWDLLPDKYLSMSKTMENAFINYYSECYNGIIDSFKYSDKVLYDGGSGTIDDPYLISTVDHLINIEKNMNSYYKLINDIDLSNIEWIPIGGFYCDSIFNGVLDGGNHKIKSLTRTKYIHEKNSRSYFGLFGCIGDHAIVKNIVFDNINILIDGPANNNGNMRAFYSVVAGKCRGKISNIELSGNFVYNRVTNGETWIGGIAGYCVNATISNCKNNINIEAARYASAAGGIVAYSEGGLIEYCINRGNISATGTDWGGFAFASSIGASTHKTNPTRLVGNKNYGSVVAKAYDNSSLFTNCNCKKSTVGFAVEEDKKF